MKTALVFIFTGLNLLVALLAYENRSSEKIVSTFVTSSLAVMAALGLAMVFSESSAISESFPASFFVDAAAHTPLILDGRRFRVLTPTAKTFQQAEAQHPKLLSDPADVFGEQVYEHLLQRMLIGYLMLIYRDTWQIEVTEFDLPTPRIWMVGPAPGPAPLKTVISASEISRAMEGNYFANAELTPSGGTGFTVPPGTGLIVRPPKPGDPATSPSEIRLESRFFTVSLAIRRFSAQRGAGEYGEMQGLSKEASDRIACVTYILAAKAQFNPLLNGHPEMPDYKNWARQMFSVLRAEFDEQIILGQSRDDAAKPKGR